MDEINNNITMPVFLQIVDLMVEKKYSRWKDALLKKMLAKNTHPNIQLFIAKILINRPAAFQDVAKSWVQPLMRLVVAGVGGDSFHYFTRDICILLVTWKVVPGMFVFLLH